MKQLLAALLLAPGLAAAQSPSSPFLVQGRVGQLNAPARVFLVQGFQLLDSASLKNGAFELKGRTETPGEAELILTRNGRRPAPQRRASNRTTLYLEPGPVVVTTADSLPNATLAGGPLTQDYQRKLAAMEPAYQQFDALRAIYRKATEAERSTPAFKARMQVLSEAADQEYYTRSVAFIKANPNSWLSLEMLQQLRSVRRPQYATEGPLYEALSPELKASRSGRFYGEMMQGLKNVAIGATAPAFTQLTPDGTKVSLADYRGRYVLVDFWASWCQPCRAENPAVLKAYNAFRNRRFDVLGVSLDNENGRDKWVKAIADDHMPWTQVSDLQGFRGEVARLYGVSAIPQNFLLDPQGKILAVNLHGAELEAALIRFVK